MQNTITEHQKVASLLDLLKTMPVFYRHSFFNIDLIFLEDELETFQFYEKVLSFDKIPIRFLNFIVDEKDKSLYQLSGILDKYTQEDNDLQKIIAQFEVLRSEISFKK